MRVILQYQSSFLVSIQHHFKLRREILKARQGRDQRFGAEELREGRGDVAYARLD